MEINSIEFYVLALFVAFALIGLIFGRIDRSPARTHIEAMTLSEEQPDAEHQVTFVTNNDGTVTITQQGLELKPGDTVNLIATIIDDKVKLVSKRGVDSRQGDPVAMSASATVKFLPNDRIHIRYESEITGEWCVCSFVNREDASRVCELRR